MLVSGSMIQPRSPLTPIYDIIGTDTTLSVSIPSLAGGSGGGL